MIIIPDIRFPNELAFVKEEGISIWVERKSAGIKGEHNSHASENSISRDDADIIVNNDTTLYDLNKAVEMLLPVIFNKTKGDLLWK